MHPRSFLDGYWRNDLRDEVFVAMSFRQDYDSRWKDIFKPAIENEKFSRQALKAIRVDIRKSGDSILTEIMNGIAHAQLILADIFVTDEVEVDKEKRCFRNGNVMYEVGIALTCRTPVEVILVQDDDKPLLFDLSHIPVETFDPDEVGHSVEAIRKILLDRITERELEKDLRFQRIFDSLSQMEVNMIRNNAHMNDFGWKQDSLPAAVVFSLPRLLDKGVLRLDRLIRENNTAVYSWTAFGRVVADYIMKK